jgi:SagB-type dehydrogenase family enzyme
MTPPPKPRLSKNLTSSSFNLNPGGSLATRIFLCYNLGVMLRKLFCLCLAIFSAGEIALALTTIELPKPNIIGKMSLEESIYRRRSEREFLDKELSLEQISQLLWAAQGITDDSFGFRAAPSAGALYPMTIYLVKKDGVFRYLPDGHKLAQIAEDDKRPSMVRASLGQGFIKDAAADIVIAVNFRITETKYGARAFRYVCIEAGHVAENIQLQAVSLGLTSVPIGAFWDDVIKSSLGLPENHDPIYIIPVGFLKR